MPAGPCTQFCFALSALLSPALCAAVDDPASRPPGERPFIGLLLPLNAPEFSRASEAVRLGAGLPDRRQPRTMPDSTTPTKRSRIGCKDRQAWRGGGRGDRRRGG